MYRNGKCTEPVEIVAELDKKEEVGKMLNLCGVKDVTTFTEIGNV